MSTSRGIAEHLGAQEEAPLDDHGLPGLHTAQNRVVVPDRRAEPNLALNELALFALDRDEDDLPIADGLDGRPRHGHYAGTRRGETHRHVHSQPQAAVGTSTRALAVRVWASTRGSM